MANKAILDEKLAKFVEDKVREIDQHMLRLGQCVQQAVEAMEETIHAQVELKQALREGTFQLSLDLQG